MFIAVQIWFSGYFYEEPGKFELDTELCTVPYTRGRGFKPLPISLKNNCRVLYNTDYNTNYAG